MIVWILQSFWCMTNTLAFNFGVTSTTTEIPWWTWVSIAVMVIGLVLEIAAD